MYEEMLAEYVQRGIFIVTFLYYTLLSPVKKHHNQPLFMSLQIKFKQIFRIILDFFYKIVTPPRYSGIRQSDSQTQT